MSDPSPVVTLDYSDPKRAAAEPVLRVVGWANAVLGTVGSLRFVVAIATGAFSRYGYSFGRGPPVTAVLAVATSGIQLVAGIGLIRRLRWGTGATALWAIVAVASEAIAVAIYAGQVYGWQREYPGNLASILLTSITSVAASVAYAAVCGAVVWWRPEVMGAGTRLRSEPG